jgi:hypothetical protein
VQGLPGAGRFVLCDDERNRLAGEDHLLASERLGCPVRPHGRGGKVGCNQNCDDAGHRERSLPVDAADSSVRFGRENRASMEKAVDIPVCGVPRRSCHLVRSVDPWARYAD